MSLSLLDSFKNLFMDQQPKDYHKWQEQRDLEKVSAKVKTGSEALEELRGDSVVQPLAEVRKKIDQLQFTVLHMIPRWQETVASKVKDAIGSVQEQVDEIRKEVKTAEGALSWKFWRPDEQQRQLDEVNADIDGIEETLNKELVALTERDNLRIGEGSDFTDHGLKQGYVSDPKGEGTFQYQSEEEWERLKRRGTNQQLQVEKMTELSKGINAVHLQKDQDLVLGKTRLETERKTSEKLRGDMTATVNERLKHEGRVKEGVINNVKFASKLAGLLKDSSIQPEELFKKFDLGGGKDEAGILNRVIGKIDGQGQFPTGDPSTIADGFSTISDHLQQGTLQGDDANKIQQFISGFVDGLTEVNETNKHAQDQFELLWEKMQTAFGLRKEDKAKLMERVDVYKKVAGGIADTGQSGKAVRKGFTRKGELPVNTDNTIVDPQALIANDISGSMHSQFLAMEIAETLAGNPPGFKPAGATVQIKEKSVLNARMLDALTLTAGGKLDKNDGKGPQDFVMHTAYEMINGVQAITGVTNKVSQETATKIMEYLHTGDSFTDAMEKALPNELFPWQLDDSDTLNKRAVEKLEEAQQSTDTTGEPVLNAVWQLVEDVLFSATDLDGPSRGDVEKIKEELEKGTSFTVAMKAQFKGAPFGWN